MRIIVNRGAGFIGSAVVRHLILDKGYEVPKVDKLTYATTKTSVKVVDNQKGYRFLKAYICGRAAVAEAFASFAPDRVMHLEAESHVDRLITGAKEFVDTNVIGIFDILECARQFWAGHCATKLETELGWKAQENFDSGIEKTVRWYLDNEWWWAPLRSGYSGSRLGLVDAAKLGVA